MHITHAESIHYFFSRQEAKKIKAQKLIFLCNLCDFV